jgi:hypothetical protein
VLLSAFDYPEKDHDLVGEPDPLLVGRPSTLRDEAPVSHLFPRLEA